MHLVQKRKSALACMLRVSDTFSTQHNTTSPTGVRWQICSPSSVVSVGQCSWSQVRDGCQVSQKPRSRCVALCVAACPVTDWCQHLLQRLYHLPEGPGDTSLPVSDQLQGPRRGPEQSCRGREQGQDTVRASGCWNTSHTRLAVFCLQGVITVWFR